MHTQRERILENVRASARARQWSGANPAVVEGLYKGCRWFESVSDYLRDVGDAHEVVRRLPPGYYTDNFQDGAAVGAVFQMPARDGCPRYVAGVRDPYNEGQALVDLSHIHESKEEAARAADGMAERYADEEREHDAKQQAEQQIVDEYDALALARADHSALIRVCTLPEHDNASQARARAHIREQASRSVRRIRTLRENYWHAVV